MTGDRWLTDEEKRAFMRSSKGPKTCGDCNEVLDYQYDDDDLGRGFRCNNVYSERYPSRVKLTDKMCSAKLVSLARDAYLKELKKREEAEG